MGFYGPTQVGVSTMPPNRDPLRSLFVEFWTDRPVCKAGNRTGSRNGACAADVTIQEPLQRNDGLGEYQ